MQTWRGTFSSSSLLDLFLGCSVWKLVTRRWVCLEGALAGSCWICCAPLVTHPHGLCDIPVLNPASKSSLLLSGWGAIETINLWINVFVHRSGKTSKFIHVKGRFLPATGKAGTLMKSILEIKSDTDLRQCGLALLGKGNTWWFWLNC